MSDKFSFERYPNYQLFKNNNAERRYWKCAEKPSQIQAQQVVTEKSMSTVIEYSLQFPAKYPALEIVDSTTTIKEISGCILKDTVLISGLVHKRISYLCFEGSYNCLVCNKTVQSNIGNIKVLCCDIPFSCCSQAAEIGPKDVVGIEYAGVDPSNIIDLLDEPLVMTQDKVTLYKLLREKLILDINYSVLRTIQTNL